MLKIIHPLAGLLAMLTVATFWLATLIAELFASEATVVAVKTAIPWGFLLLVPALAATGGSGFARAKGVQQGLVDAKRKRMPFIGANGLLILIPSALFLAAKASAGEFDAAFYVVQALELIAGAINLALLGLSMRDGLILAAGRGNVKKNGSPQGMKEKSKRWIEAGIVLASNKEAKVLCPVCQSAYLTVQDTKYGDCLERHMSCEKCGAYNALLNPASR